MPNALRSHILVNRKLPQRSFLEFYYPEPNIKVTFPFMENIDIEESKRANYATYNPVGRSSPLYAYLGAGPRQFKLSFALTLPHLEDYIESYIKSYKTTNGPSLEEERKRFFNPTNQAAESQQEAFSLEKILSDIEDINELVIPPDETVRRKIEQLQSDAFAHRTKVIGLITYWLNIIRTSVTNHSKYPYLGPPLIRIYHGILWDGVLCICQDYNFTFPTDVAGYDINSLLPRRILVSMTLEELRAGDFGEYERGVPIKQDNLAGYEAVLDPKFKSIDPGRIVRETNSAI